MGGENELDSVVGWQHGYSLDRDRQALVYLEQQVVDASLSRRVLDSRVVRRERK